MQPNRTNQVINIHDFFSGHYKRLGINMQAVADDSIRFLYAAVAMCGSQSDSNVYALTKLQKAVEFLPLEFHLVGDNAYILSEHILIP